MPDRTRRFPRRLLFLPVGLVLLGTWFWYAGRPISHPPGVLVPEAPRQTPVTDATPLRHRGYHLTPVARFELRARVLGRRRYRDDPTARLAPYDLALGWGPMSDSAVLEHFTITQAHRAYTWQSDRPPLPTREVVRHSTNIHVIPAGSAVAAALTRIRAGHLIRLRGRLVDVRAHDGTRWRTSRSRLDAGMGACEIVWVEAVEVEAP